MQVRLTELCFQDPKLQDVFMFHGHSMSVMVPSQSCFFMARFVPPSFFMSFHACKRCVERQEQVTYGVQVTRGQ
jgi:hypothetical protein